MGFARAGRHLLLIQFRIQLRRIQHPPSGGSGTWDLAGDNWLDTNGNSPWSPWPNTGNDIADFGVAPGTVVLGASGIKANGLEFDVNGYTLAANNGYNLQLSGTNSSIGVATGDTATVTAGLYGYGTATTFSGGTLNLGGATDNAALNLVVNGGTVVLNKSSATYVHAIGNGLTINSGLVQLADTGGDQIYDRNAVNVNGGTFDLNGKNETIGSLNLGKSTTANPTVLLNGGTLTLNSLAYDGGNTSPTGTGGLPGIISAGTTSGGALHLAGTNPTVAVNGWSNATSDLQINVPITASNGVTFSGFSNGGTTSQIQLGAVSTYSGPTTVQNTFLYNVVANALLTGTALNLTGAHSQMLLGANEAVGSLSGVAGSAVYLNGGTLTAGGDNSNTTFSGNFGFQASNGLAKVGSGTLTLAGGSSSMNFLAVDSGGVVLDGGALALYSVGQTGFGSNSSLFLEGSYGATMTVKNGAKLNTVDSPQLHNAASLTLDGQGTTWQNYNGGAGSVNAVHIGLAGANNTLTVQNNAAVTSHNNFQIGDLALSSNPGTGTVSVNSGGSLTVTDNLFVDAGSSLNIGGGSVSAGDLTSGTAKTVHNVAYGEPLIYLGPTATTPPALIVGSDGASTTYAGTIWGGGGMAKVGSGTFTLSGTGDNVALGLDANGGTIVLAKQSSPNVHAVAALTIDSGVVQLGGTGGNQIWDGGSVTVNGGTFDFKGNNETFTNLNFGVSTTAQPTVALNGGQLSLLGNIGYAGGTTGLAAVVTDGNTTADRFSSPPAVRPPP